MKPLRPFPFPLNIGTDICQISRIYRILRSPRGTRFVNRIFSPEEQARKDPRLRCLEERPLNKVFENDEFKPFETKNESILVTEEIARRDPERWAAAAFVAGRFAAKEAAIKAHTHRRLTFHDVVIERRGRKEERLGSGPPVARIKGEEGDEEDVSAMISISHDGDYATAVCMAHDPSVVGHALECLSVALTNRD
ncbi:holo-acyl-carrier- synthase [Trichoderma arundinaceum]|uniref:Holo-acyl-carrier-synthase n=1 Tax=Trichoderma arundinaceum TaxID=490622 RepID=A0A395NPR2_TRIAR|nr:holo-acyl-carrier- synthase [Trichoderma arundinaceum]